jgi:hypothetical protein
MPILKREKGIIDHLRIGEQGIVKQWLENHNIHFNDDDLEIFDYVEGEERYISSIKLLVDRERMIQEYMPNQEPPYFITNGKVYITIEYPKPE